MRYSSPYQAVRSGGLYTMSDEELSEAETIRRILAGEKDLYRRLVSDYKNLIFALIQRQVGKRELAEEIAQETFVKAYLNLSLPWP